MIQESDKLYFENLQRNFANMIDYATNYMNYDLKYFYEELFLKSSLKRKFEERYYPYLIGHSGIEYFYDILNEFNIKYDDEKDIIFTPNKSREYWTGWILIYYFFNNAFSFDEINEFLPIVEIRKKYNPYHEMDERNVRDRFNELYLNKYKTKLKQIREKRNLSQKDLSIYSNISFRTIQQYEQRQKNINKASLDTIYKLSCVLRCDMKDLFEPIINY